MTFRRNINGKPLHESLAGNIVVKTSATTSSKAMYSALESHFEGTKGTYSRILHPRIAMLRLDI